MVLEKVKAGKRDYFCGECGLAYVDRGVAEQCEAWCSKHKSCNLEIIKKAVKV